jgi:adenosylhomocysteine nucleosidase
MLVRIVVIISANIEWQAIRSFFPAIEPQVSPLGQWFVVELDLGGRREPVIFFHGGWGKIAAAASAQYVLDRWAPALLVNLGTCGGFKGGIEKGEIILVERTIVYDIIEQMVDPQEAIAHYTTDIDLSWLGDDYPQAVRRTLIVTGDRDLVMDDIPRLKAEYGAVAGDWESGAIAWVAARNNARCLILRGVTDLVGSAGGEAYDGNVEVFVEGAARILRQLVDALPGWIARAL